LIVAQAAGVAAACQARALTSFENAPARRPASDAGNPAMWGDRDRSRGVATSPWQFDKRTCRIAGAAAIAAT